MAFRKKHKNKSEDIEIIEPEVIEPEATSDEQEDDMSLAKQKLFDEIDEEEEFILDGEEDNNLPVKASNTLTPSDPLTAYMQNISKYPLLSREDEKKWAIKYYETKDPKAAEILVTSNLRFVVKIASEYAKFGARLIDLIQEGNVGLMQAVKEFNPYKGVKLITYAVWWIRGYIQEYLMKQYSMVKIGTTQNQRKLFYRLQKERENMERLGHGTVIKQLSGKLDIPEAEVESMAKRLTARDVSLNIPIGGEDSSSTLLDLQSIPEDTSLIEILGEMEQIENLNETIEELKPELNKRELELLNERILADEPLTLQEIGERHGVSREAIRQMEVRVMDKIKKKFLPEEKS